MGRRKKDDWMEFEGDAPVPEESKSAEDKTLHINSLGQLPVSVPVRWIDHQDDMPYPNPEIEFIRSPFPISINALAARWEGIYKDYEITQQYAEGNWAIKRAEYWDDVNKRILDSYKTEDVEFQKRILKDDVRRFTNILDRLDGDLTQGVEYQKIRGGGAFGYVKMPMTVDSIVKLANAAVNVSNLRATRVNIATQISRNELDIGNNIKEVLDKQRTQDDEQYKELLEAARLGGRVYDSIPTEPGVPIRDVTAEARVMPAGERVLNKQGELEERV